MTETINNFKNEIVLNEQNSNNTTIDKTNEKYDEKDKNYTE